jgi:hypothetical protein
MTDHSINNHHTAATTATTIDEDDEYSLRRLMQEKADETQWIKDKLKEAFKEPTEDDLEFLNRYYSKNLYSFKARIDPPPSHYN